MKYILFILFFILYLLSKIIRHYFDIELSDLLSIISIIVDLITPFIIAYFLQNKFLVNRSLKSYHINMGDLILSDYKMFISEIIKGSLNRKEISNGFKNFSIRYDSIDKQNSKRFKTIIKLQPINRSIQMLVTNSNEYNNSLTNSKVKLSNITIAAVNLKYASLLELNGDLIFVLNQ